MSRSGYTEGDGDDDQWAYIRYRGALTSALRGKRGQEFLRETLAALDAMPEKRLIAEELAVADGSVCTLGAFGKARGIDMTGIDPEDFHAVASKLGIREILARQVMWLNDDESPVGETPEQRFARMRRWVEEQIIEWEATP